MAAIQGGDIQAGFVAALVTASANASGLTNFIAQDTYAGNVVASALIGGTVSEINGGSFANGAITAAFQTMFNDLAPEHQPSANSDRLVFNGEKLQWLDKNGNVIHEWAAVSGREGFQDSDSQMLEDKGPLPEGNWVVKQDRLQIREQSAWQEFKSKFGGSAWPGGYNSWGNSRVWLEPIGTTNTYGRSGFSIHGGVTPGSAGCIDLTGSMPNFTRTFQSYGRDIRLTVEY